MPLPFDQRCPSVGPYHSPPVSSQNLLLINCPWDLLPIEGIFQARPHGVCPQARYSSLTGYHGICSLPELIFRSEITAFWRPVSDRTVPCLVRSVHYFLVMWDWSLPVSQSSSVVPPAHQLWAVPLPVRTSALKAVGPLAVFDIQPHCTQVFSLFPV